MLFLLANRRQSLVPDVLQVEIPGESLVLEYLRVNPDDEDFLVLAAIEDADAAAFRQAAGRAPEEVVVEFETRRLLETEDLATGWVDALHDRPNRAVLPGRVHRLEYEQHGVFVPRGQDALQLLKAVPAPLPVLALVHGLVGQRHRARGSDREAAIERNQVR